MYRRILFSLALLAPLAACGDASAPDGRATTVQVRAYVDANGSGVFDAGDVPVSGAAVTLQSNTSGTVLSATTEADGIASFGDVPPGSYRAEFAGTAPAGAVLATAENPTIVAPFEGGAASSEFRFVFEPGSLAGVLFRDDNGNEVLDPVDLPAPGILVELFAGTSVTGDPVATTITSESGAFSFAGLRPGEYQLVLHPLPTMTIPHGDTISVTVDPDAPYIIGLTFTGNLIQTIAQVRAEPDSATVAFEGIVTAPVGVFSASTSGNQFNVQDATGGILVLNTPLVGGPQLGDSVRVIGMKDVSAGEVIIRNPTITLLGASRPVPAPVSLSAAQVAASDSTDPFQGLLVSVGDVVVDSVQAGTSVGYNVYVSDVSGTSTFIVRIGVDSVVVPRTFWTVGGHYDITGTLAAFNAPQIKIRFPTDIQVRTSATPIGTVRAAAYADSAGIRGDTVTVEGVVHTAPGTFRTDNAYIQDATGGILLFGVPAAAALQVGDSVRVTATVTWFGGELELVGFPGGVPMSIEKLGTVAAPEPRTITGAQFISRLFEGELVRLANVEVDSIGFVNTTTGAYTLWVNTVDGQRVQIRIESNSIGIPSTFWTIGERYDIVGALSRFGSNPQLKPRSAADVSVAEAITIAEARAAALGDTVTVEGVATVALGIFSTSATGNQFNIQDPTAGVLILDTPLTLGIQAGEYVRVRAVVQVSSGELVLRSPTITRLGLGVLPEPQTITALQVQNSTATDSLQGELVEVENVTVTAVGTVSSSGGYNVTVQGTDGASFVVRVGTAAVGVPSTFWQVGSAYDVTGLLGNFNGGQVKIRSAADVVAR
jgi:DNA/RNA endonuclease YhcR with UshA esterase domain